MPRGEHPNSRKNLKKPTSNEAREIGKKGGIASGESRAIHKSLNEDLRERCTPERLQKMNEKIMALAEKGNLRAYELIRDGLGEKPRERVEIAGLHEEQSRLSELLQQRAEKRGDA